MKAFKLLVLVGLLMAAPLSMEARGPSFSFSLNFFEPLFFGPPPPPPPPVPVIVEEHYFYPCPVVREYHYGCDCGCCR